MSAEEFTAKILEVAGPVIVTAVGSLLTWLTWRLKTWVDTKICDARFAGATEKLAHFTANAIAEAEQTAVKELKEADRWDENTAKTVRDSVVDVVKRHLGKKGVADLRQSLGHDEKVIEGMIRTQIEAGLKALRA